MTWLWCYLAMALLDFVMTIVYFKSKWPEEFKREKIEASVASFVLALVWPVSLVFLIIRRKQRT